MVNEVAEERLRLRRVLLAVQGRPQPDRARSSPTSRSSSPGSGSSAPASTSTTSTRPSRPCQRNLIYVSLAIVVAVALLLLYSGRQSLKIERQTRGGREGPQGVAREVPRPGGGRHRGPAHDPRRQGHLRQQAARSTCWATAHEELARHGGRAGSSSPEGTDKAGAREARGRRAPMERARRFRSPLARPRTASRSTPSSPPRPSRSPVRPGLILHRQEPRPARRPWRPRSRRHAPVQDHVRRADPRRVPQHLGHARPRCSR